MSGHTSGKSAYAQEMYVALVNAVEALRATEVFYECSGLGTNHLNETIRTIDELLNRVDGEQEEG